MSSIGWSVCRSQSTNSASSTAASTEAREHAGVGPALGAGASMMAQTRLTSPTIERTAPSDVERRASRGRGTSGTRRAPSTRATIDHRDVDQEDRAPPEVLEQPAAGDRAEGDGHAGRPAQTPMARPRSVGSVNTLVRIDSVAGMISAPPTPMSARVAISWLGSVARAESTDADAEDHEADRQRAPAAEAVAQRPGGEQQPGEHEHVGVDDPLQLARGGAEVGLDARQGHVEDRVVEHDDQQAEAQHPEHEPPPRMPVDRHRRHVLDRSFDTRRCRFAHRRHPTPGDFRVATVSRSDLRHPPHAASRPAPPRPPTNRAPKRRVSGSFHRTFGIRSRGRRPRASAGAGR